MGASGLIETEMTRWNYLEGKHVPVNAGMLPEPLSGKSCSCKSGPHRGAGWLYSLFHLFTACWHQVYECNPGGTISDCIYGYYWKECGICRKQQKTESTVDAFSM